MEDSGSILPIHRYCLIHVWNICQREDRYYSVTVNTIGTSLCCSSNCRYMVNTTQRSSPTSSAESTTWPGLPDIDVKITAIRRRLGPTRSARPRCAKLCRVLPFHVHVLTTSKLHVENPHSSLAHRGLSFILWITLPLEPILLRNIALMASPSEFSFRPLAPSTLRRKRSTALVIHYCSIRWNPPMRLIPSNPVQRITLIFREHSRVLFRIISKVVGPPKPFILI